MDGWRDLWSVLAAILLSAAPAFAADEPTMINNPAEKYAITSGGVDIRTGQYVYSTPTSR